jgi:small GTP-binding protein
LAQTQSVNPTQKTLRLAIPFQFSAIDTRVLSMLQGQRSKWCIVTVGDYAVGKTSLIKAITCTPFSEEGTPTIGMDPFQAVVYENGTAVELVIWDTAGQERFKSLVPVYSRRADAALVVFDMTSKDSFDRIGEKVESFRKIAETGKLVFLVATKMDLMDDIQVKTEDAVRWAHANDLPLFFTSAKLGTGISDLTKDLAHTLVTGKSEVETMRELSPAPGAGSGVCC